MRHSIHIRRRRGTHSPAPIVNVLAVTPGNANELYMLYTLYDPRNAIDAGGQILRTARHRDADGVPAVVFSVADSLSCLWCSPAGHLWTASSDGNVYTNAPVNFPPPTDARAFEAAAGDAVWRATTLPAGNNGQAPLAQVIWGTPDNQVFVAGGDGSISHWNGEVWQRQATGVASELIAFAGYGPKDIWCVGAAAIVLHYDGETWTRVDMPREVHPTDMFSNASRYRGGLLACTVQGKVVQGNRRDGLRVIAQSDTAKWWGVQELARGILLADSRQGAWMLDPESGNLAVFKDGFRPVDLFDGGQRLYFIESEQPRPTFVEYAPEGEPQWGRHIF